MKIYRCTLYYPRGEGMCLSWHPNREDANRHFKASLSDEVDADLSEVEAVDVPTDKAGMLHATYVDGLAGGSARLSNIMYVGQTGGTNLGGPSVDKNGG